MELMPRIVAEFSHEELLCAYRSFERYLNEHGITGVCDVSLMAMPGLDFVRDDLFGALEEAGELTVRVSMFPTLLEDRSRLAALQAAHTGPLLTARGFKQFFDGVSSQHTAWVHDPYTNARFEGDCGRPTVGAEVMEAVSYTHLDVYQRQGDDSSLAVALFVSHRFHLNLSVNQPISLLGCM